MRKLNTEMDCDTVQKKLFMDLLNAHPDDYVMSDDCQAHLADCPDCWESWQASCFIHELLQGQQSILHDAFKPSSQASVKPTKRILSRISAAVF